MSVFVARQPIFQKELKTIGYELLFRSGWENVFSHDDRDEATGRVIHDSLMEFGFNALIGSNQAYINITRDILIRELYSAYPSSGVVFELTEDIKPDREVLAACEKLKESGYRLALDDFVYDKSYDGLLSLADIVKVDFLNSTLDECRDLVGRLSRYDVELVAEKVESREIYLEALEMGYHYFQGFFFCKPEIVTREEVPKFKLNYLRFLQEVNQPSLDYDELVKTIKREVSLSVKLLRFLNSAAIGLRLEVTSIKHALALLGERRIKKWASAVALTSLGENKPAELAVTGLVRAHFCESIGRELGWADLESDLFLAGLLSVLDGLTGRPLKEIVEELTLPRQTRDAMLGLDNQVSHVLSMVRAIELASWRRLSELANDIKISGPQIQISYSEAVFWADRALNPESANEKIIV